VVLALHGHAIAFLRVLGRGRHGEHGKCRGERSSDGEIECAAFHCGFLLDDMSLLAHIRHFAAGASGVTASVTFHAASRHRDKKSPGCNKMTARGETEDNHPMQSTEEEWARMMRAAISGD